MEYEFRVLHKAGYLHVRVVGDNTPETVVRYLKQLIEMCAKNKCPNVLVEENLEGPGLDLGEIFGIASSGGQAVWPDVRRIAYVDVNHHHDLENMRFAETVAVNRSINMRVFASVPEAENWLQGELNRPPEKS